jgi:hypothetical protein
MTKRRRSTGSGGPSSSGGVTGESPLSTLGALCVAAVADVAEARVLFRQLLIWGLSMSIVGAILCQTLAGVFARA